MLQEYKPRVLWADWAYFGVGGVIAEGAVAVVNDNIIATGRKTDLETRFQTQGQHLGKWLTPLPANPHTHLDLSLLPLYQGPMDGFIKHVAAHRHLRGPEAAQQGLVQCSAGAIGDIVASESLMEYYLEHQPFKGIAYWEIIGAQEGKEEELFALHTQKLLAWQKRQGNIRVGISPHATYTITPKLFNMLLPWAKQHGMPVQIHAAESPLEVDYFNHHGPMWELFQAWNLSVPKQQHPLERLYDLGALDSNTTLVHVVQASEADIKHLAQLGVGVVCCPRSNQQLECGTPPIQHMIKHDLKWTLGTDSKGSAPSLNVLDELQAIPDIDPRYALKAVSKTSYQLLKLDFPKVVRGSPWSIMRYQKQG